MNYSCYPYITLKGGSILLRHLIISPLTFRMGRKLVLTNVVDIRLVDARDREICLAKAQTLSTGILVDPITRNPHDYRAPFEEDLIAFGIGTHAVLGQVAMLELWLSWEPTWPPGK